MTCVSIVRGTYACSFCSTSPFFCKYGTFPAGTIAFSQYDTIPYDRWFPLENWLLKNYQSFFSPAPTFLNPRRCCRRVYVWRLWSVAWWQILTLKDDLSEELPEDRQGKMLIHTEYSLLSMLRDQDGVIHHHGLFQVRQQLPQLLVSKYNKKYP